MRNAYQRAPNITNCSFNLFLGNTIHATVKEPDLKLLTCICTMVYAVLLQHDWLIG